MFQYKVKTHAGSQMCMNVLSETDDSYFVHIVTTKDGYEVEKKVTMPRCLFEMLSATGYITEIPSAGVKTA